MAAAPKRGPKKRPVTETDTCTEVWDYDYSRLTARFRPVVNEWLVRTSRRRGSFVHAKVVFRGKASGKRHIFMRKRHEFGENAT